MEPNPAPPISAVIGKMPYRLALAGGWIDQPFVSIHNPSPPGSMVVVNVQPVYRFMDRCGMGTSTRAVARSLWGDRLPSGDRPALVKELYAAENKDASQPSGSQDMAGLIYPGVNRLDYDADYEKGVFPVHVESNNDPQIAAWLADTLHILPVNQRPPGYNPLGEKNLDPAWIQRLGRSGQACYAAILAKDASALGQSLNESMRCWGAILPHTVRHPTIPFDLVELMRFYQERYDGAMYSGCGGGYLYVVSAAPVPGAFKAVIRIAGEDSI